METETDPSPHGRYLRIAPLLCDKSRREIRCRGQVLSLTKREFDIFWTLASQPDRLLSRQELRDRVWRSASKVTLRMIDLHIAHIRKKLSQFPSKSVPVIQTVWSLGYRLRGSRPSKHDTVKGRK
jgi:DNA-binding response OmpR family regulator